MLRYPNETRFGWLILLTRSVSIIDTYFVQFYLQYDFLQNAFNKHIPENVSPACYFHNFQGGILPSNVGFVDIDILMMLKFTISSGFLSDY